MFWIQLTKLWSLFLFVILLFWQENGASKRFWTWQMAINCHWENSLYGSYISKVWSNRFESCHHVRFGRGSPPNDSQDKESDWFSFTSNHLSISWPLWNILGLPEGTMTIRSMIWKVVCSTLPQVFAYLAIGLGDTACWKNHIWNIWGKVYFWPS